jgi:DNA polymerase-3 subunit chi
MTQIDFYTNATDKFRIACVIATKAFERGLRTLIYTPDAATSAKLDDMLWSTPALSFIPHCRAGDELAATTPIVIDHRGEDTTHDDVLLNLCTERPPFFSRFQRLVEIVGLDDEDKAAARARYRFYRERGYPLDTHDTGKKR